VVPAGRYLSGRIHLKSNVTLYLSPGSVLLASTDNANFDPYETFPFHSVSYREATYFHYALVAAEGVHDIAIKLCERVTIRGITVRNSPDYSIRFWGTERGYIDPRYFQPNEVRFGSRVYNPSQKTSGALDRRWYHKG
jgi:polygalacturonase